GLDRAEAAARAASERVGVLRTDVAGRLATSGGRSVEELDAVIDEHETAVQAAAAATRAADAAKVQLARLRAEADDTERKLAAARATRESAAANLVAAEACHDAAAALVAEHRADFATVDARAKALRAELDAARRLAEAITARGITEERSAFASAALAEQLGNHRFADADAAGAARRGDADRASLERRIKVHDDGLATARGTLDEPGIATLPAEAVDVESAAAAERSALADRDAARGRQQRLAGDVERLAGFARRHAAEVASGAERLAEYEIVEKLARTVAGETPNTMKMRLENFVLAAELEEIVTAANARLRTMSGGRYLLEHTDAVAHRKAKSGLGLEILDQHTGQARPPHSLSGGETFLASLALALGLAEVVTGRAGGITLDTLFIDEGFGSLDADTLAIAMGTLDSLRSGGRTIGLISHVEAMQEQIPARLDVDLAEGGWSIIRQSR
ncbi:SbcC/MukB-like Walker B domain-containing protein, partial [Agromyces seonyuensis]